LFLKKKTITITNQPKMIERVVKLSFQSDKTAEFIAIFNRMQPIILQMQGCTGVRLLRDTADANVFFTHSIWASVADLDEYRASDVFRNTWQHVKTLFTQKPEAWSVEVCVSI
jgi:heme-degrading monooxygenase HmoA